ncbi:18S rRNA biogenesis protein [Rhizophagus clarus]|uniref:18S rRNA biogenesis protein n=1 Tax=Rhizophagus clarus TaxID=94130 RepID=A0A8H3L2F7_9GLOM|nr:18S rRNA biogenesis protein [Rhizophagus clarus]
MKDISHKVLKFSGHGYLRQRLILATLSGQIVKIDKIRSEDDDPGLRDFEASFLRLLEKVTNGSTIEINYSGTAILYKPGVITGGKIYHECGTSRAIGYFLEPLIALAPFGKQAFDLTLTGITNDNTDISVDSIRTVTLLQLRKFGIEEELELKIIKRGSAPLGGGEINFKCPIIRSLKPMQFTDEDSARSVLNRYIPDVYIFTDVRKGEESGKSPGFALNLVAESTTGVLYCSEQAALPGETPEDVGNKTAKLLLNEISNGGCVDSLNQWLILLLMVLGPEDVSKIRIGKLTAFTIQYLRDLKTIFDVNFKIKLDSTDNSLLMACVGVGYVNYNKKTT